MPREGGASSKLGMFMRANCQHRRNNWLARTMTTEDVMAKSPRNQPSKNPSPPFPARSCWSAPARWAAPCSTAGSLASCRRRRSSCWSRTVEGHQGAGETRRAHQSQGQRRRCRRAGDRGEAADRARRAAAARAADRRQDHRGLDHGGTHARLSRKHLPDAAVVRAMPNTPAAIGRGMTVAVGNRASRRRPASWHIASWSRPARSSG